MKKWFVLFDKKSIAMFELTLIVLSVFSLSFALAELETTVSQTNAVTNAPIIHTSSWSGVSTFGAGGQLATGTYTGIGGGSDLIYTKLNGDVGQIFLAKGQTATITSSGDYYNIVTSTGEGVKSVTIKNAADIKVASGSTLGGGAEKGTTYLSDFFGAGGGTGADALISGLEWAGLAYLAGMMIGDLFGMSEKNTKALSTSLSAGAGIFKTLATYDFEAKGALFGKDFAFLGTHAGIISLGIGAIVFIAMYRKVDTEVVTFDCLAWQAPTGGNDCEACNDETLPCSEYRCKSLGQSCEIVPGKEGDVCVYVNPRDVEPPVIRPNEDDLTVGHGYKNVRTSPPGPGFEIVNLENSDGCLKAFTPLEFGIKVSWSGAPPHGQQVAHPTIY